MKNPDDKIDEIRSASDYFRTPVSTGLEIMDKLSGRTSGQAIPAYVIDAPGGGGKIPILPEYFIGRAGKNVILLNYKHEIFTYRDVEENPADHPPRRSRTTSGRRRC